MKSTSSTPAWVPAFAREYQDSLIARFGLERLSNASRAFHLHDLRSMPTHSSDPLLADMLELAHCHRLMTDPGADSAWRRLAVVCDAATFPHLMRRIALARAEVLLDEMAANKRLDQTIRKIAGIFIDSFGAVEAGVAAAVLRAVAGVAVDRRRLYRIGKSLRPRNDLYTVEELFYREDIEV